MVKSCCNSTEHRHEVRKDAKKLRYAAEFFSSLFKDERGIRRYKRFIAAMEELQGELGGHSGDDVIVDMNAVEGEVMDWSHSG
ncbi:CHAD domain-containing protein [Neorhizobium galegae]|uniref:CHAD domain-containing protein n=1 Tax=Neorhizobium galegae TaxID=399 RepID=UPI00272C7F53|nr:CHAD domain-containing protein [Neorhizobium galegae]